MAYESPVYTIIQKFSDSELRFYEAFSTIAVKENSLAGNSGFGYLFNYISGGNQSKTKMSMTVPVINDTNQEIPTMEFVIPQVHVNRIPQPQHHNMMIKNYPAQYVLVKTFSGLVSDAKMKAMEKVLNDRAKKEHLQINGTVKIARYNSPFSLPFLRHNEMWFTVLLSDSADTIRKV
jgi:hypothetical protein